MGVKGLGEGAQPVSNNQRLPIFILLRGLTMPWGIPAEAGTSQPWGGHERRLIPSPLMGEG